MKLLTRVPVQIWLVLATVVVVIGGAAVLTATRSGESSSEPGSKPDGETTIGQEFTIQGATHIESGQAHDPYNSDPPTSGPHYFNPAKNGVHDTVIVDETLVHNLEHGFIWIAYKPDISEETKNELKKFVEDDDWKMVMAPRPQNDAPIILVSWGRYLKLQDFDENQVKKFRNDYRNRGPEKTPS